MRRLLASRSVRYAVAAAAGMVAAPLATGALLNWNNAAGGSAGTAANWNPVQAPTGSDDLTFNLAGAYSVTFGATATASRTQAYRDGTLTLSMSAAHTTSNGVAIADLAGDSATVTLTTGTWSSGPSGFVMIGDAGTTNGTLNVNDDDAEFVVLGTSDLFVGNNGTGTLSITGGGRVTCNDTFHVGQGSAATGNLTVSGFVGTVPFPISTLDVLGTGESRWGNGGDATVNITNGARAQFAGDLVIANLSTSVANVTVQGNGLVVGATVDVAGDLLIARNNTAGTAAGSGTLNVNSPGRVLVDGTTFVAGDPDGGTGTLTLGASSLVDTATLTIGAGGTLNHNGGTLRINGGAFTGHALPLTVTGTGSPTLQLSNNLSKTIAPVGGVGLVVGSDTGAGSFSGTLRVDSGADLIVSGTNGDVIIGEDSLTTGTITIDGAGSRLVADQPGSDWRIGANGDGTLNILNGGRAIARNLLVPATSGVDGVVLIDDLGSALTCANLTIGHASGIGTGEVTAHLGTTITATEPGISVLVRETGTLVVDGELNATGTILLNGGQLEVHGTAAASLVDVAASGFLQAGAAAEDAEVNGPTIVRADGFIEVAANDLTIGDASDPAGFVMELGAASTISSGQTLTLLDQDRAQVTGIVLAAGTLAAPNGIQLPNNGTIDGSGTITTAELFFDTGGSVITATGASGITINGKLRNNSGMIDGTKYTFNNNPAIIDSGWTGAGTIDAQVVFNSGTEVNALANMTMGDGTNFGVTFNAGSELHADTRTVTLLDANGVGLPSVTDLSGGHVVCTQPLTVNNGRRLSGRGGSIDSPLVTVNGRLSPGELIGVPVGETGELTINGNLTLGANANTDIEIGGLLGPIQYDAVVVNGVATLSGDLNLSFVNGFNPPLGSTWVIMRYHSKIGDFSSITGTGGLCGLDVAVGDTAVVARIGLVGDTDNDGDVDLTDLSRLLAEFGCQGGVEFPCPIDFDFNGDTDLTDLSLLLSNFGLTCL